MDPRVSIVIPSRARSEKLRRMLELLEGQEVSAGEEFEVVVALDGYPQTDVGHLPSSFSYSVKYILLEQVGISAAKNAAVAEASGEIIVFANDDVEPCRGFVHHHVEAHSAGHEIVLGSSPWAVVREPTLFDGLLSETRMIFFTCDLHDGSNYGYRYAWNLNLSVARRLVDRLSGPFAESLRPVFYDDVEFAYRLMGGDERVFYCEKAEATHSHRYTFPGYFEREALLGIMAHELYEINADCFRDIFGSDLAELIANAQRALPLDHADARRTLALFSKASHTALPSDECALRYDGLYAAHLPLKRRAFRCGLLAQVDFPDTSWQERFLLATDSLRRDAVFSSCPYWQAGG